MIGIITVNYRSEEMLSSLIDSLLEQDLKEWVFLAVNNSIDDKRLRKKTGSYQDRRLMSINTGKNIGFARANNMGFEYLMNNDLIGPGDIVLFCNPDVIFNEKDTLSEVSGYFNSLDASFIGPKIVNEDGSQMMPHMKKGSYIKCFFHIGNNGRIDRLIKYNSRLAKTMVPVRVFLINGSCLFARAKDFKKAGMFDPNTFLYYEEEILFKKVSEQKMQVYYIPGLVVFHVHSAVINSMYDYLKKKEFVHASELYFLGKVLKCNNILLKFFIFERKIEFFFAKLLYRGKAK